MLHRLLSGLAYPTFVAVQVECQKPVPAALPQVRNEYGGVVATADLIAQEASIACQALFLLLECKPRVPESDITRLLSLLRHLEATHAAQPEDCLRLKNAYLVAGAVVAALTPQPPLEGQERPPDEGTLRAFCVSGSLVRSAVESLPTTGGFTGVARLAWATLAVEMGGDQTADERASLAVMGSALQAGTLRFLKVRSDLCCHSLRALCSSVKFALYSVLGVMFGAC